MSSSNSPCAACKFLRRKCTQECVFAPYFPPEQPQKFSSVHRVFGASNVTKLLNELNASQREDAVNSLAYEAEERLRDPVYGCVGLISLLQHRLKQLQSDLYSAKQELSTYIGPQAMLPMYMPPIPEQHQMGNPSSALMQQQMGNPSSALMQQQQGMVPMMGGIPSGPAAGQYSGGGGGQLVIHDPQRQQHQQRQQQIFEAQQLAAMAAARDQEMLRAYSEQQQHQQEEIVRFTGSVFDQGHGSVTATGFNQNINPSAAAAMSPSLALGTFDNAFQIQPQEEQHNHPHPHHHPHPHQFQAQLLLQPHQGQGQAQGQALHSQQQQQQQQRSGNEEDRSVGPSC